MNKDSSDSTISISIPEPGCTDKFNINSELYGSMESLWIVNCLQLGTISFT